MSQRIDFQTDPSHYRHWRVAYDGPVATLYMDVDENGGLFEGYQLKLNSYDLGVDIELADVVQRMRFEHPEVKAVVLRSGKDRVFCAGANIRMLGGATHAHKVNFCKFTNETRNAFEAAGAESGQHYICAIKGACAGGGYELALACDHIMLDRRRLELDVALPEVPLLAVLPGTGGLTRVTDKRKVRRDLADVFCSIEEGVKGKRAAEWRLVDEVVANSQFDEAVAARAREFAAKSRRRPNARGRHAHAARAQVRRGRRRDLFAASRSQIDRERRVATITLRGPDDDAPASVAALHAQGAADLAAARSRANSTTRSCICGSTNSKLGVVVFKTAGRSGARSSRTRRSSSAHRDALARARNPAVLEARAEAHRPDLALAGRADRERLLLRRHPRRDRCSPATAAT